jgi:pimeloyl-ACP methyl ester carboxylesterase
MCLVMGTREKDRITPTGPALDDYGRSDGRWLEIDWSEHLRQTTVTSPLGETRVDYVELGEGPPVLFVHGLGGSWRNWLENLPFFAENNRVIAIDLPGFGTSPMPPEQVSISAYGDLVVAVAVRLGLGPETALVGHSMGGFISTEAVSRAPRRFSTLTLVAAAGITFATMRNSRKSVTSAAIRMIRPLMANRVDRTLHRKRLRAASFSGLMAHPSLINREILWELASYVATAPGMIEAADALYGYDSRRRLSEIAIPTLVMWGRKDRLVPVAAAYDYLRRIHGAELSVIADTGHMVQMERPARFNREVAQFISGPAAG